MQQRGWLRPKAHRTLPQILGAGQVTNLLDGAIARAEGDPDPVALRDVAIVELLYATGIRVGELSGLDVDDLDDARRTVRVFGKGAKERTVPFGAPAEQAIEPGDPGRRAALVEADSGEALFLGGGGVGSTRGRFVPWCTSTWRGSRTHPISVRMVCGTPRPRTCLRAAPICAPSKSCWATLRSLRPRSTLMFPSTD